MEKALNWVKAFVFISPNLVLFLVFTLIPLVASLVLSFFDWNTFNEPRFVGAANYVELLGFIEEGGRTLPSDPDFWYSMFNTVFMMLALPLDIFLPLLVAVLLNRKLRGESIKPRGSRVMLLFGSGAGIGLCLAVVLWFSGLSRWSALLLGLAGATTCVLALRYQGWLPARIWQFFSGPDAWLGLRLLLGAVAGTFVFFLVTTLRGQWLIGLCLALLAGVLVAWSLQRLVVVTRMLLFLPTITAGVALMLMWMWILNPDTGAINRLFYFVGIEGPDWLNKGIEIPLLARFGIDPLCYWAKPALMMMGTWGAIGGTSMILFLAGLQGIDPQLYEAAEIDGAGPVQKFIHITWPSLAPTTFFILITSIIGSFQAGTASALVMTGGGPDLSTTTIGYYIFSLAFQYFRMGYAAAVAWILFGVVLVLTLITWRWGKGTVN